MSNTIARGEAKAIREFIKEYGEVEVLQVLASYFDELSQEHTMWPPYEIEGMAKRLNIIRASIVAHEAV